MALMYPFQGSLADDETFEGRFSTTKSRNPYLRTFTSAVRFLRKATRHANYWIANISGNYKIGDVADLDTEGFIRFSESLNSARLYLEYGSGGSTVQAARYNKNFVSVENNESFRSAVRRKIGTLTPSQKLLHVNVGLTGPWGKPLFRKSTPKRVAKWAAYPEAPWATINETPDLVLVDGRFRVACALSAIEHAAGRPMTILVDDYRDRPYYKAIEEFAELKEMYGRMAVFHTKPIMPEGLRAVLEVYRADWR